MQKNMGGTDKFFRIIAAIIFIGLFFSGKVVGAAGIALLVLGIVFLLTSFISFCPLYTLFGLNTCKKK